jgi:putative ABC transport system permease protein
VTARHTLAFDFAGPIPERRVYQVRSVPGVAWAEGMIMSWTFWQRRDGSRLDVEMVGLDSSCVGAPWALREGNPENVHQPTSVIVDELYLDNLGVSGMGDDAEILGNRAIVRGISQGVRTFTAAPFVFTSIKSARKYIRSEATDDVTYVLARCAPGFAPEQVRDAVLASVPEVDCLTAYEFASRTMQYWMLKTGAGITVVATAFLAFVVSAVVISQTLFTIVQEQRENYAALLAIGFSRVQLSSIVVLQSLVLGVAGMAVGSGAYAYAAHVASHTPLPMELTPVIFAAMVATSVVFCLMASFVAVRAIFRVDPGEVFRA